jgi:hypothetical protein
MEGDVLVTQELFRYREGHFEETGVVSLTRPSATLSLRERGRGEAT